MAESSSLTQAVRDSKMLAYAFGAVALIAGLVLIFWPEASVKAAAVIIGVFSILGGVMLVAGSFAQRKYDGMLWLLMFLRGLVNVGIGAALVFWPGVTVSAIVWLFGIMLIATGLLGLVGAIVAPSGYDRTGLIAQGVLELALGIVLVAWPGATVRVITLVVGIGLALMGLSLLISGARLKESDLSTA